MDKLVLHAASVALKKHSWRRTSVRLGSAQSSQLIPVIRSNHPRSLNYCTRGQLNQHRIKKSPRNQKSATTRQRTWTAAARPSAHGHGVFKQCSHAHQYSHALASHPLPPLQPLARQSPLTPPPATTRPRAVAAWRSPAKQSPMLSTTSALLSCP